MTFRPAAALACAFTVVAAAVPVAAADLGAPPTPTAAVEQEPFVGTPFDPHSWQIRVRGLGVITNDKGKVNGVKGSDLSYSESVIPELDITYFFIFTPDGGSVPVASSRASWENGAMDARKEGAVIARG